MTKKIQIIITQEEFEIIKNDLNSLVSYMYNDDHTHKDKCFSEGLAIINCNSQEIDT